MVGDKRYDTSPAHKAQIDTQQYNMYSQIKIAVVHQRSCVTCICICWVSRIRGIG